MYKRYFGLDDAPFSITPDPRFVYLSPRHEDALAHLRFGIGQGGGGGFVQLTGEVGTGKTTLCRLLLEELPDNARAALLLNPRLEPLELLEAICDELGISTRGARGSQKQLVDRLNKYLLEAHAEGLTVVLIIDEAQNLSRDALEQVRLLTNLETATQKLLQIVLLGQPELRPLLARSDLRQLSQRITARYHLGPLNAEETAAYTRHRMAVAGCAQSPFTAAGLGALYRASGGVPRLINIIAERSLLAAYATDRRQVGRGLVQRAAAEVLDQDTGQGQRHRWMWAVAATAAMILAIAAGMVFERWRAPGAEAAATVLASAVPEAPEVSVGESSPEPVRPPAAEPVDQPVPAAASSEQAPPTGNEIDGDPLFAVPPSESFGTAMTRLFGAHGLTNPPALESARCPLRLGPSVYCLEGRASFFQLEQLARPVIVQMPTLEPGFAVVELAGGQLIVATGEGPMTLQRTHFEQHWNGRYWDIWQMPSYVPTLLREGDRGPGVLWVKSAASMASPPYPLREDDPYFGPALKTWVEDFQTHSGIRADGLIGPETLQMLSRYANQDEV